MAGSGFFAGTMSPAKTAKRAAFASPTACSSTARTDSSADVDATASIQPAAIASSTTRAIPGRAGSLPARTISLYRAVLRLCRARTSSGSSITDAIRSLPPPICRRRAYSASSQTMSSPASANAWLKAGRCPSRSVSASTPSQSKISAGTLRSRAGRRRRAARGAEHADVVLGHVLHGFAHVAEHRRRVLLGRIRLEELAVGVDERDLERRRDVHLRAAARDQIRELRL